MADLIIVNGKIVTPRELIPASISIYQGKIEKIGSRAEMLSGVEEIDAQGGYVIPGLVDPHVHFGLRGPKNVWQAIQEEWKPETCGAIHGGVTTLLVMLCWQQDYLPAIESLTPWAEENSYGDFGYSVVVQNEAHIKELEKLFPKGITSYKHFFTAFKGKEGEQIGLFHCDEGTLFRSFVKIAELGPPALAMVHAEDSDLYNYFIEKVRSSGRDGLEAWADARPNFCESLRVESAALMAEKAKAALHFVHISTKESLEILAKYMQKGVNISAEAVPHTLTVSKHRNSEVGVWGKFVPPLRGPEDMDALWMALRAGVLQHVATDHCCYTREEKERGGGKFGSIWQVPPGISNVMEHWLPVMMTYGVNQGRITIQKLVEVCCENNAKRFGLYPRKGAIVPGADADLVILDPNNRKEVDEKFYHGRNRDISVHWGETLAGIPRYVLLRGKVIVDKGQMVSPKCIGRFTPSQRI